MSTDGGERALQRMRRYTTGSFVFLVASFVVLSVLALGGSWLWVGYLVAGGLLVAYCFFWERPAPLWLSIATIATTGAVWSWAVFARESPVASLLFAVAMALPISQLKRHKLVLAIGAYLLVLLPIGIAAAITPDEHFVFLAIGASFCELAAAASVFLNRYAWNLYLEIDAARRVSAQLAVAQERFRFAADLHDIQGHTLHVIRLKTQLAAKLLERDPASALEHLREADTLIGETLANTRDLAFGDRHVAFASELANARELFEAAGIRFTVAGAQAAGSASSDADELFGLVVREATTNILRHSQATTVSVIIEPGRLRITNDGSPAQTRPLSGLARLGDRFEAIGGTLRTVTANGEFTTEAIAR